MNTTMPRPKRKDPVLPQDEITLSLRIPGWIYNPLVELAGKERRSLTAQILHIVERQLEAERKDLEAR